MTRTTGTSLADMTAEIRQVNIDKGWRPADGSRGGQTFGELLALLHCGIGKATQAYSRHGLADATRYGSAVHESQYPRIKPQGVGSELAGVLIHLLDMADRAGVRPVDMDCELADVEPLTFDPEFLRTFGDHMAQLHHDAAQLTTSQSVRWPHFLRALIAVADRYDISLAAEYERKIAYNRTRPYQHGGRTLAGTPGSA